jgi:hypothetical protein
MTIWHWLIALGIFALIFHTAMPGTFSAAARDVLRDFKKAADLPVWFTIVVASFVIMCLLVIAKRLTA